VRARDVAYGSIGGYVAANELITEVLRMTCPAYGFTATLPPGQAMVTSTAIDVVRDEPERRRRLWDNQRYFVQRMADLNYKLVSTETPIVPIWLGDEAKAEQLARAVREEGIHVDAITFPGVPIKSAVLIGEESDRDLLGDHDREVRQGLFVHVRIYDQHVATGSPEHFPMAAIASKTSPAAMNAPRADAGARDSASANARCTIALIFPAEVSRMIGWCKDSTPPRTLLHHRDPLLQL
jgi:Aminotransferase class I and II